MVLQRSNFEIPAQFSFQPFSAVWRVASAETEEWVEEPKLRMAFVEPRSKPEKNWIRVRIQVPNEIEAMLGLNGNRSDFVTLSRTSLPPSALARHENYLNSPDISGRSFELLVCEIQSEELFPVLSPGRAKKNAWLMRDEFLNLDASSESNWIWSLQGFLNKWGLWGAGQRETEGTLGKAYSQLSLLAGLPLYKHEVICLAPHQVKAQQEKYSKARLSSNRRNWLRSHPMSLQTVDEPPFFLVQQNYCTDAIETTITIDHLAGRQFGICKRCHAVFEKETKHKREYCSRTCINAANVQRWREEQRESREKGAKRNANS